jgi:hypothetical protein
MDLEEFMAVIRPEIEADIDAWIEAEPDPHGRQLLRRYRSVLVDKAIDANRIANLKHQLATAEKRLARLEPQLVQEDQ